VQTSEFLLETERLRLRLYTRDDLNDLASIVGDPVTMRYYPRPFSRDEASNWIERNLRRYTEDGHGLWAMVSKGSGEFVGNCGLVKQWVDGREEIEAGWLVARRRWNQGLATEAATACRDYGFDVLDIDRLISMIRPENEPSRRVAEKIGMSIEKELVWGNGNFLHLVYVLFKRDRPQ
jgi:[ribosomal protein S5]-alanine N-acetyltransferase